jgi:hypothetical protein
MDKLLKELFGEEWPTAENTPLAQATPATAATATGTAPTAAATPMDADREAHREARRQRRQDAEARRQRKEFIERYTTGDPSEGFSSEEAIAYLREMRDEMSPSEFRAAMEQTLEHLPPDQRDEFVALMQEYKASQAAKRPEGMAATQEAAAASMASTDATAAEAKGAADPFGGILTGLMGGAGGAASMDVGDILADLTKGGLSAPKSDSGQPPTQEDFQALVNSPIGRAVLGGLAAYGMQNMETEEDRAGS